MAMVEQWHIKSRGRACAETGRTFEDGETICTALFFGDDEDGFSRRDFSLEAWDARPPEAEQPFSFWRSVYQAPVTEEKPQVVRKENAEDLLKRLVEEDEEHTENVRFILAVMLERQKLLRETDTTRTPTGILRVYEHRKNGDVFLIKDPDIPLDQVEAIQTEVLALLEPSGQRPESATAGPQEDSPAEPAAADAGDPDAGESAATEASDAPPADDGATPGDGTTTAAE